MTTPEYPAFGRTTAWQANDKGMEENGEALRKAGKSQAFRSTL
jgi:hypothetical protein